MDNPSIVEFFYNIIPGGLFVFVFNYLFPTLSKTLLNKIGFSSDIEKTFLYLVVALFLGFFFQAITKLIRSSPLSECVARSVFDKNNQTLNKIFELVDFKPKEKTYVTAIYLLDAYLKAEKPAFLSTHFSSLFTFWLNIFVASVLLLTLPLFIVAKNTSIYLNMGLIVVVIVSGRTSYTYLNNYYDSVIKAFFMTRLREGKSKI